MVMPKRIIRGLDNEDMSCVQAVNMQMIKSIQDEIMAIEDSKVK